MKLEAVEHFTGRTSPGGLGPIRFIGGGANSRLWCQTMTDNLDRPIDQVDQPAAANARGAALLAAIALGELSWADVAGVVRTTERFEPDPVPPSRSPCTRHPCKPSWHMLTLLGRCKKGCRGRG